MTEQTTTNRKTCPICSNKGLVFYDIKNYICLNCGMILFKPYVDDLDLDKE